MPAPDFDSRRTLAAAPLSSGPAIPPIPERHLRQVLPRANGGEVGVLCLPTFRVVETDLGVEISAMRMVLVVMLPWLDDGSTGCPERFEREVREVLPIQRRKTLWTGWGQPTKAFMEDSL